MKRTYTLEDVFFVVLLMVATIGFVWIVRDFLESVFWAALLASLFHGVHVRLMARLEGRPSASAMLVLVIILLIVILPLFFVGLAVTRETLSLYQRVTSGEIDLNAPMQWSAKAMPIVNDLLARVGIDPGNISEWLSTAALTASRFLAGRALSIGQNTLSIMVQFFLMMYLVFFFVRDGAALLERLVRVIPLGDQRERRLFRKFAEVSRATLKGTVVVAIVQGTLGGLSLAVVGIDGAVFWGVVMAFLSLVPLGAWVVWLPAAVLLAISGSPGRAVIVAGLGFGIVSAVDNILRPFMMSGGTSMNGLLVLVALLGGVAAFGMLGLVLGPILVATVLALLKTYMAHGAGKPAKQRHA